MNDRTRIAERIGQVLDEGLGPSPGEELLERRKRALVAYVAARPVSNRLRWGRLAGVAVAAMALLALVGTLVMSLRPSSLSFTIGEQGAPAREGVWVRSGANERVSIDFEDGSRFELYDRSSARVVEATSARVQLDLNNGVVHARIEGREKAKWVVRAGPYQVTVLGTVFSVSWHDESGDLQVEVDKGRVWVEGAELGESGVTLEPGYILQADSAQGHVILRSSPTEPAVKEVIGEVSPAHDGDESDLSHDMIGGDASSEDHEEPATEEQRRDRGRTAEQRPVWQILCEAGDLRGAVAAAEQSGLSEVVQLADMETLWKLAKNARYGRRPLSAAQLLEGIRARFPTSVRARTAAYLLARLALDSKRNPEEARRWLRIYLKEAPGGAFAGEALGHLVEVCTSTGRDAEAASTARVYLERYPQGPFCARAREVLER